MRRLSLRGLVIAAVLIGLTIGSGASARTAADDVTIQVFLRDGNNLTTTSRLNFQLVFEVESGSGVEQPITIRTQLPVGLRWGTDGPDPAEGCMGTDPAICATKMQPNEVGTIGAGYLWDVVAEHPGVYEITASVEPTEPDPDVSNNTDTFRVEVTAAPAPPGGSGGSGGGGSASATASAARLAPAKPRAGATVAATVRVTAGGAAIRPSRVACAGSIGMIRLKGVPKAASGSAICTFRTPRAAKGKTLRGSVAFTARGQRFTKRFSATLG